MLNVNGINNWVGSRIAIDDFLEMSTKIKKGLIWPSIEDDINLIEVKIQQKLIFLTTKRKAEMKLKPVGLSVR